MCLYLNGKEKLQEHFLFCHIVYEDTLVWQIDT